MKQYNMVLGSREEKNTALQFFRDRKINITDVAGYFNGYIIHIETDQKITPIEEDLINLLRGCE